MRECSIFSLGISRNMRETAVGKKMTSVRKNGKNDFCLVSQDFKKGTYVIRLKSVKSSNRNAYQVAN